MQIADIDDVDRPFLAHRCDSCGGHWLDEEHLHQLEQMTDVVLFEIRSIPDEEEQKKPLVCPRCGDWLAKRISARDQKVTMDRCRSCNGIWLDGGEMEAIREEGALPVRAYLARWLLRR